MVSVGRISSDDDGCSLVAVIGEVRWIELIRRSCIWSRGKLLVSPWSAAVVTGQSVIAVELWRSVNPGAMQDVRRPVSRRKLFDLCPVRRLHPTIWYFILAFAPRRGKRHGDSGLSVSGGQLGLPGAISTIVGGRDTSWSRIGHASLTWKSRRPADRSTDQHRDRLTKRQTFNPVPSRGDYFLGVMFEVCLQRVNSWKILTCKSSSVPQVFVNNTGINTALQQLVAGVKRVRWCSVVDWSLLVGVASEGTARAIADVRYIGAVFQRDTTHKRRWLVAKSVMTNGLNTTVRPSTAQFF